MQRLLQPMAEVVVSGETTRDVREVSGVRSEVAEVVEVGDGGRESEVSGKAVGGGMDDVAGSYSAWQLAGGCSGVRG